MKHVTCPACGAPLQALSPSSSFCKQAVDVVKAQLGIDLHGPQVLFPVGPLVVHQQTVHPDRPLRKYLSDTRMMRALNRKD